MSQRKEAYARSKRLARQLRRVVRCGNAAAHHAAFLTGFRRPEEFGGKMGIDSGAKLDEYIESNPRINESVVQGLHATLGLIRDAELLKSQGLDGYHKVAEEASFQHKRLGTFPENAYGFLRPLEELVVHSEFYPQGPGGKYENVLFWDIRLPLELLLQQLRNRGKCLGVFRRRSRQYVEKWENSLGKQVAEALRKKKLLKPEPRVGI